MSDGSITPTTDGLVIVRAMLGLTGLPRRQRHLRLPPAPGPPFGLF